MDSRMIHRTRCICMPSQSSLFQHADQVLHPCTPTDSKFAGHLAWQQRSSPARPSRAPAPFCLRWSSLSVWASFIYSLCILLAQHHSLVGSLGRMYVARELERSSVHRHEAGCDWEGMKYVVGDGDQPARSSVKCWIRTYVCLFAIFDGANVQPSIGYQRHTVSRRYC